MADTLTVHFRGLSGTVDYEVPQGTTVGEAARQAGISDEVAFRSGGQALDPDAPVSDGVSVTTSPPEVKQGR